MRIAVLGGAGAMGGVIGAALSRGGADVTLVDVSRPAIEVIQAQGLKVEDKDGRSEQVPIRATDRAEEVGQVDLIINFVKCYHTEAAVRAALPTMGPSTSILTLQNGWGNAQRIAALAGEDRVMVGLTYNSGTLVGPGHVKHTAKGVTVLGEMSGQTSARLQAVDATFRAGGLETTVSDKIIEEVWKKLSVNACALPIAALLRFTAAELASVPPARVLVGMILREVVAVAQAKGLALDHDERWTSIVGILERAGAARASMLQDVEGGRQTEIEVINGAISAAGRETGVATPVNDTLVALIQALQAKYLAERVH